MRRALLAGIIATALSGGFALTGTNAQGVQVPTLSEHEALVATVSDLEDRVAVLEHASTSTTSLPPTTTTSTTQPPPTTTTTTVPDAALLLPENGVVPCDDCIVKGIEGFVYSTVNANGSTDVVIRDVVVNGAGDAGGPLQTGTVSARNSTGVVFERLTVRDSPRSCVSIEGASNLQIRASVISGCDHLGVHGGFLTNVIVEGNDISDFSRNLVDQGWESGGMKLTNGNNIQVLGNYVHDGNGPGIWFDIYADSSVIRDNRIEDVTGEGIFVEISRDVQVENNTVLRAPNSFSMSRMSWCYGAGILVSTASSVVVSDNLVEGSIHGILVIDQSWRNDTPQGYDASAYAILDNTVRSVNKVGACEDVGRQDVLRGTWAGNTFENVQSFLPPLV